ncbi:hypothetical protein [Rhizobium leguminosarum]|uniref:ORC-CDC6 family AAA ATPase n=1 Tax=Rhizobium leguminosarum TaxID=384 RepID=UPI001C95A974|nr:hypothetical protein [Rhizobium leguminosarum]MBY5431008.1 hypothetical protein [Rhizobium leguminosarum]
MAPLNKPNPFSITRAVDLNDSQIEELWVTLKTEDDSFAVEFHHPTSKMPTYILGAKGSGKTHLMRHQAFELQKLRYLAEGITVQQGVKRDGYIGLYMLCSGLSSNRFSGKRQSGELWENLFAYYFELWVAQQTLALALELELTLLPSDEEAISHDIAQLFDKSVEFAGNDLKSVLDFLISEQKGLDYEINNCLMKGSLDVDILVTPGKLIFGIPRILSLKLDFLKDVLFVFSVDEFENLTEPQQRHVNTLYRERENPTTFRIGARTYGIRTHATNSAGEENIRNSEFIELRLDEKFRELKPQYGTFCRTLASKRLTTAIGALDPDRHIDIDKHLASFDARWDSEAWRTIVNKVPARRPHFIRLSENLSKLDGVISASDAVQKLSLPQYPLLEKLNLILFYQRVARGGNLTRAIEEIAVEASDFIAGRERGTYGQSFGHYSRDLTAQLLRESGQTLTYGGFDTFVRMSGGIPRALLTILRSIYEWSIFENETPFEAGLISLKAQHKGVVDASDWYYNHMRKAGIQGQYVQAAIDRLARLFRISRFGDKPIESSLSSFSVAEDQISSAAREVLKLAEARAFLHRIKGGQKERNSDEVTAKFQISPMLAPRWDIPMARRGIHPFNAEDFNTIFDPGETSKYAALSFNWTNSVTFPFRKGTALRNTPSQPGLFDD